MKKKVKRYVEQMEVGAQNRHNVLRDFSMLLDNQVSDETCLSFLYNRKKNHLPKYILFIIEIYNLTLKFRKQPHEENQTKTCTSG